MGVLASQDFVRYCRFVHRVELARHMLKWVDLLQSEDPSDRSFAIAAAPETWKSRMLRMWTEYSIGRKPEWARILAMNAATQAEKQMKAIQATIEHNPRYRMCFPHVIPDKARGWSGNSMYIKRKNIERPDPTLFACGVTGPIQGLHAEEIIVDDPTDQQDVRSPSVMQAQRDWVKGVLTDRLIRDGNGMPVGKFGVILTRWGSTDLWPLFTNAPENEEDPGMGFRAIQMPIYDHNTPYEWGPYLWPESYPASRCEQLRLTKGPALFATTYLCNPAAMGGLIFDRDKLASFDPAGAEEFNYRIHSWDVAGGSSDMASWTVCIELCVNQRGFFITHVWRARAPFPEVKRMLYRMREDRKPNVILIEEKAQGQSLIQEIDDDGGMPELRKVNPQNHGDKESRAQRHAGLLETGRLFVPRRRSVPWLDDLVDEMASFPVGASSDQVDALSQALDYARGNIIIRSGRPVSWMRSNIRQAARAVLDW